MFSQQADDLSPEWQKVGREMLTALQGQQCSLQSAVYSAAVLSAVSWANSVVLERNGVEQQVNLTELCQNKCSKVSPVPVFIADSTFQERLACKPALLLVVY